MLFRSRQQTFDTEHQSAADAVFFEISEEMMHAVIADKMLFRFFGEIKNGRIADVAVGIINKFDFVIFDPGRERI